MQAKPERRPSKDILAILLPATADNVIRGAKPPIYVFMLIAIVSTVRSFIHLLAPDSGAGSIAGMDLSVAGAKALFFPSRYGAARN